jgi:hypothetical protein
MGFKPMFEEERLFFKEKTNIDLPTECWRNGSKIYLDFTQPKPLIEFKVTELSYIVNDNLRNFIAQCLDGLPDYFRHMGASTSGKYHPAYT